MKNTMKNSMIFLLIGLFLTGTSFAEKQDDPSIFLKPNPGRLIYIVNNSETFPLLSVGYQFCSFDMMSPGIKAWLCPSKNLNIAIVQKNNVFTVSVPSDLNGVEYAVQIFSAKNAAIKNGPELLSPDICRANGDKDTLMLTDVAAGDNRIGKIKCNMLTAFY